MRYTYRSIAQRIVPIQLEKCIQYCCCILLDSIDLFTGKRDRCYPPRRIAFSMEGVNGKHIGREFLQHFRKYSALQPSDTVLDIGSGAGRMAIPLTTYLLPSARYEGFDVNRAGVQWCQRTLTQMHPNFRFTHANIYNAYYNRRGDIPASAYRFPYDDATFDVVFAASVFTHLLEADVVHYLSEIKRVLKPAGRYFFTSFLLDDRVHQRIREKKTHPLFCYRDSSCPRALFSRSTTKEAAVAYEKSWMLSQLNASGLGASVQVYPGQWAWEEHVSYQDIITGSAK